MIDNYCIGANIRYYRLQRGMFQEDLGEALHVSKSLVSAWERGVNHVPRQRVPEIARALQVSEEQLLGLTEEDRDYLQSLRDSVDMT